MRLFKLMLFLLFVVSMFGCQGEPGSRFKRRHNAFISLLNNNEAKLYKSRLYSKAGELLSNRMKNDKGILQKFNEVKKSESIEFFPIEKVFVFFGDTIRRQISFYDFVDYLSDDERSMFQKMKYKDLVYSLQQKNSDSAQKKRYDEIVAFGNLQGVPILKVVKFLRDTNTVYKKKYSYDKLAK